jgi:pimeloyl-ACP methyl ester carboxylesterase
MDYGPTLCAGWHQLHADRHLNYQLNRWAAYGGLRWIEDVRPFTDQFKDYEAWCTIFVALGECAESEGRTFHAALHFRAAELFMARSDARKEPLRRRLLPMLRTANGVPDSARREVPFQNARIPVWQFGERSAGRDLVVFGGFGTYVEDFFPVLTRLGRDGWHVVAFEGPGQGSMLQDQDVPFTPHWHGPVSAVLDALGLDDVTLVGLSLGGCLAIRAAAYESRVRRVIAFDVLADLHEVATYRRPKTITTALELLLAIGLLPAVDVAAKKLARNNLQLQWMLSHAMEAFHASTPAKAIEAGRMFHTRDVSHLVTQDVLLMAGTDDHIIPIEQLLLQSRLLTSARSITTRVFTAAEQAHAHCRIGNLPLALHFATDWVRSREVVRPVGIHSIRKGANR